MCVFMHVCVCVYTPACKAPLPRIYSPPPRIIWLILKKKYMVLAEILEQEGKGVSSHSQWRWPVLMQQWATSRSSLSSPYFPVIAPQKSEEVQSLLFPTYTHKHTVALGLPVIISLCLLKYWVSGIRKRHAGKDSQSRLLIPRKAEPWILPPFNQVKS